MKIYFKI